MIRLRLALDCAAALLLVGCLAYWWLDNLAHEVMGAALFALLGVHAGFNRRWYAALGRGRWTPARAINAVAVAGLGAAMLALLVTSLLISRDLFAFLAFDGAFALRAIHMFAAFWAVLALGLHLGTRWGVVMAAARSLFGLSRPDTLRTGLLRLMAAGVALQGIRSSAEMAFGSKLALRYTLDMWDFGASTLGFFVHYLSIVGLYAVLAHYAIGRLQTWRRPAVGE